MVTGDGQQTVVKQAADSNSPEEPFEPLPRRPTLSWPPTRSDWLRCLDNWPLLRQIAVEPAFGWFCLAALAIGAAVTLGLPRIWRLTPAGFSPCIRVRGIDFLQAHHHRNQALAARAQGDETSALLSWK